MYHNGHYAAHGHGAAHSPPATTDSSLYSTGAGGAGSPSSAESGFGTANEVRSGGYNNAPPNSYGTGSNNPGGLPSQQSTSQDGLSSFSKSQPGEQQQLSAPAALSTAVPPAASATGSGADKNGADKPEAASSTSSIAQDSAQGSSSGATVAITTQTLSAVTAFASAAAQWALADDVIM
jgi:hypothetical protein